VPFSPDIAELMMAVDGLEECREVLFEAEPLAEWQENALREMNRALAILHAHIRQLLAVV
jgi:hypothetical protein